MFFFNKEEATKVTCNVDCWRCVIECELCPLFYKIREIEQRIDGKPEDLKTAAVYSERDLEYWHLRNVFFRQKVLDRIKAVLDAWSAPAETIEKALVDNDKAIKAIRTLEPSEQLIELFFKVIPLHLAIGLRKDDNTTASKIDKKYWEFCVQCDPVAPDECQGLNVGELSARQRLTEPRAYIVDPDEYFKILCCIAEHRYLKAKDQLAQAEADYGEVSARIKSLGTDLEQRRKTLFDDYRAAISKPIDCSKYTPKTGGTDCGCKDDGTPSPDPTVAA